MTLAPRVEVYTQIACRTLHGPSTGNPSPVIVPTSSQNPPTLPHTDDVVRVQFQDGPIRTYDECTADPRVQARAARIQACMPSLRP
jgi:hypothetical protein